MKRYTKTIDGKAVIKTRNEIVLRVKRTIKDKNGNEKECKVQIINPKEEQILADGWLEYITPEPTDEEKFASAKRDKTMEIEAYDTSEEVNQFYIKGIPLWLDREERATLQRRFEIEQKAGKTDSVLWKNGVSFPLVIAEAMQMLDVLEMYAISCYDNTQRHIVAVNAISTLEELEAYDYTTGYPDKLRF